MMVFDNPAPQYKEPVYNYRVVPHSVGFFVQRVNAVHPGSAISTWCRHYGWKRTDDGTFNPSHHTAFESERLAKQFIVSLEPLTVVPEESGWQQVGCLQ